MFHRALVVASLCCALAAAQKPKPMTPAERQALLKSALDEMRLARSESDLSRYRPGDNTAAEMDFVRRNRSAGEKLARVLAETPKADPQRNDVALKAGQAWKLAGDDKRAIGFYEDVAKSAKVPPVRLQALMLARACYTRSRNAEGAKDAVTRMRAEVEKLSGKDKAAWEDRLRRIDKADEKK